MIDRDKAKNLGGDARSEVIATRVEPALLVKIRVAAAKHERTVSEFVRIVLIEKIKGAK